MANSGDFKQILSGTSTTKETYAFYVYWMVSSQSKKTLSSKLYISCGLKKIASNTTSYNNTGSATLYATYNGETVKNGSVKFDLRQAKIGTSKSLFNKTITVYHEADGTCQVPVYAKLTGTSASLGDGEISAVIDLPVIATASTITATNAYIGKTSAVKVSRKETSNTHSIAVSFGNISGWINEAGEIVDEEVKMDALYIPFTLPDSFYDEIPDDTSGKVKLTCTTYVRDYVVGTPTTATFTASCDPDECKPTCSFDLSDTDAAAISLSGGTGLVRYLSDVKMTVNATAKHGASILYTKAMGSVIENGSSILIENVEENWFDAYAMDSRGFSVTTEGFYQYMAPYFEPVISAQGKRLSPTSNDVDLSVFGKFYTGYFGRTIDTTKNTLTVSYQARVLNGEWGDSITLATFDSDNDYSVDATVGDIDYRYTWEIKVTAADAAMSKSVTLTIPRGIPGFDWGQNDFRFHIPITFDEEARIATLNNLGPVTIYRCWTNSNVASSFAAQDIDTGITDGDLYMVTYAYGTTILAQKSVIAPMGKSARMDGVGAGTSSIEVVRTVSSSGGVLSFGSGYKSGAADNSVIIPARIYVIKGVNTV